MFHAVWMVPLALSIGRSIALSRPRPGLAFADTAVHRPATSQVIMKISHPVKHLLHQDDIVKSYNAGLRGKQLAAKHNLTIQQAYTWVRKKNLQRRIYKEMDEIVAMAADCNFDVQQTAAAAGVERKTVLKVLRMRNLSHRMPPRVVSTATRRKKRAFDSDMLRDSLRLAAAWAPPPRPQKAYRANSYRAFQSEFVGRWHLEERDGITASASFPVSCAAAWRQLSGADKAQYQERADLMTKAGNQTRSKQAMARVRSRRQERMKVEADKARQADSLSLHKYKQFYSAHRSAAPHPSPHTILHRYGTWEAACADANLTCGTPRCGVGTGRFGGSQFSTEDVLHAVGEFVAHCRAAKVKTTVSRYNEWAVNQPGKVPRVGAVRTRLLLRQNAAFPSWAALVQHVSATARIRPSP